MQTLIDIMEKLAPRSLALPGDPGGLQIGSPGDEVQKILVVLDAGPREVDEACRSGANLIICHHPFLYNPPDAIDPETPKGGLIKKVLLSGINIYASHTNLDISPEGVNQRLAHLLELENISVLEVTGRDRLLKLVVFVPEGHEDEVRNALSGAGAGWIGGYSHCTFQSMGTGTFLPREGTDPFIGETGRLEKVSEYRLETILPLSLKEEVLEALWNSHPYEEVAFDLYPLENEGTPVGLGRSGYLKEAVSLEELARRCQKLLKVDTLQVAGDLDRKVRHVALCGGKGGGLLETAIRAGAEVFISGDLTYHDLRLAAEWNLPLIDAGHFGTEYHIIPWLADYLRDKLTVMGYGHMVETLEYKVREPEKWYLFKE